VTSEVLKSTRNKFWDIPDKKGRQRDLSFAGDGAAERGRGRNREYESLGGENLDDTMDIYLSKFGLKTPVSRLQ